MTASHATGKGSSRPASVIQGDCGSTRALSAMPAATSVPTASAMPVWWWREIPAAVKPPANAASIQPAAIRYRLPEAAEAASRTRSSPVSRGNPEGGGNSSSPRHSVANSIAAATASPSSRAAIGRVIRYSRRQDAGPALAFPGTGTVPEDQLSASVTRRASMNRRAQ